MKWGGGENNIHEMREKNKTEEEIRQKGEHYGHCSPSIDKDGMKLSGLLS